ncbi:hypothetical protein ABW19_dt0205561 [Dactylella cylindrospora]|nr:hypothetical protein ABW19_dt0205561 [Dactylella cylindrospora]
MDIDRVESASTSREANNSPKGIDQSTEPISVDSDDEPATDLEVLEIIETALARLSRLGATIRQSSITSRAARIVEFAERSNLTAFEHRARTAINCLYPDSNESLRTQLTRSIVETYAKIVYNKQHQQRLNARRVVKATTSLTIDEDSILVDFPVRPPVVEIMNMKESPSISSAKPTPDFNQSHDTAKLESTPSTLNSLRKSMLLRKINAPVGPEGESKCGASSVQLRRVTYPPPPKETDGANYITCDWCLERHPRTLFDDRKRWSAHLNKDFEPYVCISEKCMDEKRLPCYATFKEWLLHMNTVHSLKWQQEIHKPTKWVCRIKHPTKYFETAEALYKHGTEHHLDAFTKSEFQAIAKYSCAEFLRSRHVCPLCSRDLVKEKRRKRFPARASKRLRLSTDEHTQITTSPTESEEATEKIEDEQENEAEEGVENEGEGETESEGEEESPEIAMARHIASHLQIIMFLTIRLIECEKYGDDSAEAGSTEAGSTDGGDISGRSNPSSGESKSSRAAEGEGLNLTHKDYSIVGIGSGVPTPRNDIRLGDVVVGEPTLRSHGVWHWGNYDGKWSLRMDESEEETKRPVAKRLSAVLLKALAKLKSEHLLSQANILNNALAVVLENDSRADEFFHSLSQPDRLFQQGYFHVPKDDACGGCDSNLIVERIPRPRSGPYIHYGPILTESKEKKTADRETVTSINKTLCIDSTNAAELIDNFPCLFIRGICDYADSHRNGYWKKGAAIAAATYTKLLISQIPEKPGPNKGVSGVKEPESRQYPAENAKEKYSPSEGDLGNAYSPVEYSIGLVCGLQTEYIAAQALLDIEHNFPSFPSSENKNVYTLGTIGWHNVVIATPCNGYYGSSSAAPTVTELLKDFRDIKIILMVGVGGCVPSESRDVRLGDIVVAISDNDRCGLIQFAHGFYKTTKYEYGPLRLTGISGKPPHPVRRAVYQLGPQQDATETNFLSLEGTNILLERYPMLRTEYQHSTQDSGIEYSSKAPETIHRYDSLGQCKLSCSEKGSNLVLRPRQPRNKENPVIHHGMIASTGTLIVDAKLRDMIASEYNDILCFETQAANLMDNFPCLVIRGICNYSDGRTSDSRWLQYAALVAAAYAKELLHRISPKDVETEARVVDTISSTSEIPAKPGAEPGDTNTIIENPDSLERTERLRCWLSAPDPSTNQKIALQKRHKGSGRWFLNSEEFFAWKLERNSFLWIPGNMGSGKTVLSSIIIDSLHQEPARQPVLYFYFDHRDPDKQSLESMMRSLVCQLYFQCAKKLLSVEPLFSRWYNRIQQPDCQELCDAFSIMVEQVKEVWLVLDALDECSTLLWPPTRCLLPWIKEAKISENWNVHLLATSRPDPLIESRILEFASTTEILRLAPKLTKSDIKEYIDKQYLDDPKIKHRLATLTGFEVEFIEDTLRWDANGMFLWVAIQINRLKACVESETFTDIVHRCPPDLVGYYAPVLRKVLRGHSHFIGTKILRFLAFCHTRLTVRAAIDALAVDIEEGNERFSPEKRTASLEDILSACHGLVITTLPYDYQDSERETVLQLELVHESVKDYLTSDFLDDDIAGDFHPVVAQTASAKICLTYLLHLDVDLSRAELEEKFPFAWYCALNWMKFAKTAEGSDGKLQEMIRILFSSQHAYRNSCRLYPRAERNPNAPLPLPLHDASRGNLVNAVKELLKAGADINALDTLHGTALQAAVRSGAEGVINCLLDNGADVNIVGGEFASPLILASCGLSEIVERLLKHGADVNARGSPYGNALHAAIEEPDLEIIQVLLQNGADINSCDERSATLLYRASIQGYKDIVDELLLKGADVNRHGRGLWTPLHAASEYGYEYIVSQLLKYGADVSAICKEGSALQIASGKGRKNVADILLRYGADVNAQCEGLGSALQLASQNGHKDTVDLLLRNRADVNAQGGYYGNALQAASCHGHVSIVNTLLGQGANVNAQGGHFGTVLQAAVSKKHYNIIQLLLQKGADVNIQGGHFGSALQAAAVNGYNSIVALLLSKGATMPDTAQQ